MYLVTRRAPCARLWRHAARRSASAFSHSLSMRSHIEPVGNRGGGRRVRAGTADGVTSTHDRVERPCRACPQRESWLHRKARTVLGHIRNMFASITGPPSERGRNRKQGFREEEKCSDENSARARVVVDAGGVRARRLASFVSTVRTHREAPPRS